MKKKIQWIGLIALLYLYASIYAYAEGVVAARSGGALNSAGTIYPIVTPNINLNPPLTPPVTVQNGPNGSTQTQVGTTTYYAPGTSSVTNGNKSIYSNGTSCVSKGFQQPCN